MNPYYIDWAITNKCNLRCEFCTGLSKQELSTDEAIELAKQIVYLKPGWLIIEGGEPFMRSDLKSILDIINNKIPTYIITNGNNLDRSILCSLRNVKIIISLDGITKEVYENIRKGGSFPKVLEGIRICLELNMLHGLIITLSKKNFHQIDKFFEFVSNLTFNSNFTPVLIFIPLKPTDNQHYYLKNKLTPLEQKEAIDRIYKNAETYGINVFYDEPFIWAYIENSEFKMPESKIESGVTVNQCKGCAAGGTIYIQADGEVRYCMFSPKDLAVGNVRKDSLTKIWEENILGSQLIKEFRNQTLRTGECKICDYFENCHGCLARIYSIFKTPFESDPACPLMISKNVS